MSKNAKAVQKLLKERGIEFNSIADLWHVEDKGDYYEVIIDGMATIQKKVK